MIVLPFLGVFAKVAQAARDAGGLVLGFDQLPDDVVRSARESALEPAEA